MITERTLRNWRKEALESQKEQSNHPSQQAHIIIPYAERILRMTQELLDQHLLRKESK